MEITMMNKTTKDIISDIATVIRPLFESKGFTFKKNYFESSDDSGNIYQYEINLSKNKGYFSLHLRLKLLNKYLMRDVNSVLEKALRDSSYKYHSNWSEGDIEASIKTRTNDYCVSMITDWRCFKNEDESLDEFRKRFSIWMCVFNDINEVNNWEKQLTESVELSLSWFSAIGSDEWIIENTLYPALLVLKRIKPDKLDEKYKFILSKARSENEAKLFFNYLNNT